MFQLKINNNNYSIRFIMGSLKKYNKATKYLHDIQQFRKKKKKNSRAYNEKYQKMSRDWLTSNLPNIFGKQKFRFDYFSLYDHLDLGQI